jgi:hypothetical protein
MATVKVMPLDVNAPWRGYADVTIPNGTAVSDWIDAGPNWSAVGVRASTAWTSAAMSFEVSYDDGVTPHALYTNAGAQLSYSVQANAFIRPALAHDLSGAHFFRIVSGTTAAKVNQAADRVLRVMFERPPTW